MNVLAIVLIIYVATFDFCSAQPRIKIDEYAFKDSDISITCDTTRAQIRSVSFVAIVGGTKNDRLYTVSKTYPNGRKEGRHIELISSSNNFRQVRLNMTNVQCTDARDYACSSYSDVEEYDISDVKFLKVVEMPGNPRVTLGTNEVCPGTLEECEECRRDGQRSDGNIRKVGESFRIECSSTKPAIGTSRFMWYYRDNQGNYMQITQNVTDDRHSARVLPTSSPADHLKKCISANRITSRLDFTPNPEHHYGTNLVIRCNMTYKASSSSKAIEKSAQTNEICLIGDRVVSSTESSTAKVGQSGSGGLGAGGIAGIVIAVIAVIVLVVILVYFLVYKKKSGAGKKPKSTPRDYKPEPDNYDDNDPNSRRGVDNDAMAMDGEKPPPPQKQTGRQGRENRPIGMDQTPPEHNIYRRSGDYDGNGFNQPQGSAV